MRRITTCLLAWFMLGACGGAPSSDGDTSSGDTSLAPPSSTTVAATSSSSSTTVTSTTSAPSTTTTVTTTTTTTVPSEPPGLTWDRVPHDELVFGGPNPQVMLGVTAGGPGLVAVGYDAAGGVSEFGDLDAAVWTSVDGIAWDRVPHDEAVFGGQYQEMMTSVVAGGPGLIAVGYDMYHPAGAAPSSQRREVDAAVWVSADGIAWSRVPHSEAVFGGDYVVSMQSVAATESGFVAVGYRGLSGSRSAVVWTSPDGLNWSRVPHSEAVFGGTGDQEMLGVAAAPPGVVAVGRSYRGDGFFDAAVWVSVDGRSWSRIPGIADFSGPADQSMNAVAAAGPGVVAVGSRWTPDLPGDRFAVIWTSPDGYTWTQVPADPAIFGGRGSQELLGVVAGGPGVIAVGADSAFTGGTHVWVSRDGLAWTRVLIPEEIRPYSPDGNAIAVPAGGEPWYQLDRLRAVVVAGPGLVAVGDTGETNPSGSAVVIFSPA